MVAFVAVVGVAVDVFVTGFLAVDVAALVVDTFLAEDAVGEAVLLAVLVLREAVADVVVARRLKVDDEDDDDDEVLVVVLLSVLPVRLPDCCCRAADVVVRGESGVLVARAALATAVVLPRVLPAVREVAVAVPGVFVGRLEGVPLVVAPPGATPAAASDDTRGLRVVVVVPSAISSTLFYIRAMIMTCSKWWEMKKEKKSRP